MVKFKKYRIRHVIQIPVLVIDKYRYGENFVHHKDKISLCRVNPLKKQKQFIKSQFLYGKILLCRAKKKLLNQGFQIMDFPPKSLKKQMWGF
jgi:hypothetical protein